MLPSNSCCKRKKIDECREKKRWKEFQNSRKLLNKMRESEFSEMASQKSKKLKESVLSSSPKQLFTSVNSLSNILANKELRGLFSVHRSLHFGTRGYVFCR